MSTALSPIESSTVEIVPVEDGKGAAFTVDELREAEGDPDKVVTTRPSSLGYASIVLIIVNRMVGKSARDIAWIKARLTCNQGTGIFRTPTTVAQGTHSTAYTLMFWGAGAIVAICGTHVFAEFGMTVPRLEFEGAPKESVPRNGGEKNYLEYMIKSPKRLATCLYGIPFIVLGTAAGNALICAECLLRISVNEPSKAAVRALAVGIATFACLLHATSRTGGIYLFNLFGVVKVAMLVAMFVLGVAFACGAWGGPGADPKPVNIASDNLSIHNSTADALGSAYGYAEAFLAVLFAFGGFNQATYVSQLTPEYRPYNTESNRCWERLIIRGKNSSQPRY